MPLGERIGWLVLGMAVGFVLGYIVALLRDITEGVDEIDTIVKEKRPRRVRGEGGFMRIPVLADVLYILALVIVVWGAFSAQKATNEVEATQNRLEQVTSCNEDTLTRTVEALNERTQYTAAQATRNVELQRAQYQFLAILLEDPPPSDARISQSLRVYIDALGEFVVVNTKATETQQKFPYPTPEDYQSCLND